jgi:Putative amidase domain
MESPLLDAPPQAALEEAEGFFDRARAAARDAWDFMKTQTRIAGGEQDENRLANLVFFDRHQNLSGQRLSATDPRLADLRREWLDIRDRIVRPAIAAARAPRYDRAGALSYARKFWNRPCDDDFIALGARSGRNFRKVDPGAKFVHEFDAGTSARREHAELADGSQIPWPHLDDCTHFISCCIGQRPGEACGGLRISPQMGAPPAAPYGIVRVSSMVEHLTRSRFAEIVAEKSEDDTVVGRLQPGDLIAYFSKAQRRYSHMTLLLEDNKIACHTYCRSDLPDCTWDNDWRLGAGTHQWTFLRFIV